MSPPTLSALESPACLKASYNGILNVISQRHGDPVSFLNSSLQQATCQVFTLPVKTLVCQANSLMAGDNSVSHVKHMYGAIIPNAYAVRSP